MYLGDLGKRKRFKKLTKKLTKIAKPVVRAVAAYYTGGASEALLAQRKRAKQQAEAAAAAAAPPPIEYAPAMPAPAAAITSAAQSYYASRSPRAQPSSYAADEDAPEGAPRQAGLVIGGMKIPPALLIAGVAVPLLFILLPARGSRR